MNVASSYVHFGGQYNGCPSFNVCVYFSILKSINVSSIHLRVRENTIIVH